MACKVCGHKARAAIEAGAKGNPPLDVLVEVCTKHDVTRAVLERHLAKCPPANKPARRRRGLVRCALGAAPDSGPRTTSGTPEEPPLPPPRELAAPDEELRRRAQLLTRQLEHMIETRAEVRHIANVSNALAVVDKLMLAREKGQRPIHEHPDFELVYGARDDAGVEAFEQSVRRLLGRPPTSDEIEAFERDRDDATRRIRERRAALAEAA